MRAAQHRQSDTGQKKEEQSIPVSEGGLVLAGGWPATHPWTFPEVQTCSLDGIFGCLKGASKKWGTAPCCAGAVRLIPCCQMCTRIASALHTGRQSRRPWWRRESTRSTLTVTRNPRCHFSQQLVVAKRKTTARTESQCVSPLDLVYILYPIVYLYEWNSCGVNSLYLF